MKKDNNSAPKKRIFIFGALRLCFKIVLDIIIIILSLAALVGIASYFGALGLLKLPLENIFNQNQHYQLNLDGKIKLNLLSFPRFSLRLSDVKIKVKDHSKDKNNKQIVTLKQQDFIHLKDILLKVNLKFLRHVFSSSGSQSSLSNSKINIKELIIRGLEINEKSNSKYDLNLFFDSMSKQFQKSTPKVAIENVSFKSNHAINSADLKKSLLLNFQSIQLYDIAHKCVDHSSAKNFTLRSLKSRAKAYINNNHVLAADLSIYFIDAFYDAMENSEKTINNININASKNPIIVKIAYDMKGKKGLINCMTKNIDINLSNHKIEKNQKTGEIKLSSKGSNLISKIKIDNDKITLIENNFNSHLEFSSTLNKQKNYFNSKNFTLNSKIISKVNKRANQLFVGNCNLTLKNNILVCNGVPNNNIKIANINIELGKNTNIKGFVDLITEQYVGQLKLSNINHILYGGLPNFGYTALFKNIKNKKTQVAIEAKGKMHKSLLRGSVDIKGYSALDAAQLEKMKQDIVDINPKNKIKFSGTWQFQIKKHSSSIKIPKFNIVLGKNNILFRNSEFKLHDGLLYSIINIASINLFKKVKAKHSDKIYNSFLKVDKKLKNDIADSQENKHATAKLVGSAVKNLLFGFVKKTISEKIGIANKSDNKNSLVSKIIKSYVDSNIAPYYDNMDLPNPKSKADTIWPKEEITINRSLLNNISTIDIKVHKINFNHYDYGKLHLNIIRKMHDKFNCHLQLQNKLLNTNLKLYSEFREKAIFNKIKGKINIIQPKLLLSSFKSLIDMSATKVHPIIINVDLKNNGSSLASLVYNLDGRIEASMLKEGAIFLNRNKNLKDLVVFKFLKLNNIMKISKLYADITCQKGFVNIKSMAFISNMISCIAQKDSFIDLNYLIYDLKAKAILVSVAKENPISIRLVSDNFSKSSKFGVSKQDLQPILGKIIAKNIHY